MVSKICEIFEMIDQAEELNSFISKWKKFLNTSSKEQQLEELINQIESNIQEIESNLPFWQEKIKKKLKFNSWRKSQRNRSKTTKKLFRICKLEWKQRTDSEYESLQKSSLLNPPKASKSAINHIKALLNILKSQDPDKYSYYSSKLNALTQSSPPLSPSPLPSPIYPYDTFLKDYISLLTTPSYQKSREDLWSHYTQNS